VMNDLDHEPVTSLRAFDFDAFYKTKWDDVYRAMWVTFRDADLAAEATDEAMTRAYQHWSRVCTYRNPAGWVYRVATNWAHNRLRRRRLERNRRQPARVVGPPEASGVVEAVGRLPMPQRQVVVLRLVLDWSESETAEALEIKAGTVKSRLSRALTRLREELG
jgi:DNA-directed RNA polymerase specialized sigma24 family protein